MANFGDILGRQLEEILAKTEAQHFERNPEADNDLERGMVQGMAFVARTLGAYNKLLYEAGVPEPVIQSILTHYYSHMYMLSMSANEGGS